MNQFTITEQEPEIIGTYQGRPPVAPVAPKTAPEPEKKSGPIKPEDKMASIEQRMTELEKSKGMDKNMVKEHQTEMKDMEKTHKEELKSKDTEVKDLKKQLKDKEKEVKSLLKEVKDALDE